VKDYNACVELELQVRRALGWCGRFGLGGIADADFIENGGTYTAVVAALAPHYVRATIETQKRISQFIKECAHLQHKITDDNVEVIRQCRRLRKDSKMRHAPFLRGRISKRDVLLYGYTPFEAKGLLQNWLAPQGLRLISITMVNLNSIV
jgi:hypothetical protein